jgi:putative PIN family toxin of toxin-antitoxin system
MVDEPRLPRVVIDTNLFVSGAITPQGLPHQLLQAWLKGAFTLLISAEQRAEVQEVLSRPEIARRYNLSEESREQLLFLIDTLALQAPLRQRLPIHVRDPKDDHLLAAALGGKADYLITDDEDLLTLDRDPKLPNLRILAVRPFLHLLIN